MNGMVKRGILWLIPACAIFVVIGIYPLLYSLWLSFHSFSLADPARGFRFTGFGNYGELLFREGVLRITFLRSLCLTGIFAISCLLLELLIGMGLALLFSAKTSGTKVARVLVMIPMLLAPVVVGNIFKLIYAFPFGLLNFPFLAAKVSPPAWLTDWALVSLIITSVWEWTPFSFLVILAAMYAIPVEYYEASKVDGASSWHEFRFITLPLIKSAVLVICLIRSIDLIRTFDLVWVLTEGGPGIDTALVAFNAYYLGFKYFEIGAGSAYAYLILLVVNAVVIGFLPFLAKEIKA